MEISEAEKEVMRRRRIATRYSFVNWGSCDPCLSCPFVSFGMRLNQAGLGNRCASPFTSCCWKGREDGSELG